MICTDKSLAEGPEYLSSGERYRVGRSSTCSFVINDLSVSRFHAEVIVTEEKVRVKDLRSRNGTFVDGVRVEEVEVEPGQSVRFGAAHFHLIGENQVAGDDLSEISTHYVPSKAPAQPEVLRTLTDMQGKVLDLLLTGLQEKEVASRLDLSRNTVHNHVKGIYRKLGVTSRPELLARFLGPGPVGEQAEK
jgi:pSer/pThr/pTyr-binding forkhead associated (FHA) protein